MLGIRARVGRTLERVHSLQPLQRARPRLVVTAEVRSYSLSELLRLGDGAPWSTHAWLPPRWLPTLAYAYERSLRLPRELDLGG